MTDHTVKAMTWAWVAAGNLRVGDVIRWPGSHAASEEVTATGVVGLDVVEVATEYTSGSFTMPAFELVEVRLPRPDEVDVHVERARAEMAGL